MTVARISGAFFPRSQDFGFRICHNVCAYLFKAGVANLCAPISLRQETSSKFQKSVPIVHSSGPRPTLESPSTISTPLSPSRHAAARIEHVTIKYLGLYWPSCRSVVPVCALILSDGWRTC